MVNNIPIDSQTIYHIIVPGIILMKSLGVGSRMGSPWDALWFGRSLDGESKNVDMISFLSAIVGVCRK